MQKLKKFFNSPFGALVTTVVFIFVLIVLGIYEVNNELLSNP